MRLGGRLRFQGRWGPLNATYQALSDGGISILDSLNAVCALLVRCLTVSATALGVDFLRAYSIEVS